MGRKKTSDQKFWDHVDKSDENGCWLWTGARYTHPMSDPNCPGTVPTNIIPLCHGIGGCNNSKRDKDAEQWLTETFSKRKAALVIGRIMDYFNSLNIALYT